MPPWVGCLSLVLLPEQWGSLCDTLLQHAVLVDVLECKGRSRFHEPWSLCNLVSYVWGGIFKKNITNIIFCYALSRALERACASYFRGKSTATYLSFPLDYELFISIPPIYTHTLCQLRVPSPKSIIFVYCFPTKALRTRILPRSLIYLSPLRSDKTLELALELVDH